MCPEHTLCQTRHQSFWIRASSPFVITHLGVRWWWEWFDENMETKVEIFFEKSSCQNLPCGPIRDLFHMIRNASLLDRDKSWPSYLIFPDSEAFLMLGVKTARSSANAWMNSELLCVTKHLFSERVQQQKRSTKETGNPLSPTCY